MICEKWRQRFQSREALQVVQTSAEDAPKGSLLSALGGIHPDQFSEKRYPTMLEMDDAAPNHSVYLSISNWGPGATNSRGKELLEKLEIPVRAVLPWLTDETKPARIVTELATLPTESIVWILPLSKTNSWLPTDM